MRIVVTGATGNVGTALVAELLARPSVDTVVGVARRRPDHRWPDNRRPDNRRPDDRWTGSSETGPTWWSADVAGDDLGPAFRGADALVHLAWASQPAYRPATTWAVNVLGTKRVLRAAVDAGIGTVVVASCAGAYSPRTSLDPVDESWPTDGVPTVAHSREKAYVERLLDAFERDHPEVRLVRLRPAFIFRPATATGRFPATDRTTVAGRFTSIGRTSAAGRLTDAGRLASTGRRTAAGRLTAAGRTSRLRTPALPDLRDGLSFQALHAADVARASCQAVHRDARGAFNLAADPVIDLPSLAGRLGLPLVRVPPSVARVLLTGAWSARLLPASPQVLDLLCRMPLLDTTRARDVLGWTPHLSSYDALWEL